MHRPIPAFLLLALGREVTIDRLLGRWQADVGSYDFTPTEAVVTLARGRRRQVLPIRSIEIEGRKIVVNWAEGSHTSFGGFTGNSMCQLAEPLEDGTLAPQRRFHRCP